MEAINPNTLLNTSQNAALKKMSSKGQRQEASISVGEHATDSAGLSSDPVVEETVGEVGALIDRRNPKHQRPNTKETPSTKHQNANPRAWF